MANSLGHLGEAGRMSATYYNLLGNPVQQSGYNQFGRVDHVFTSYNFDQTPRAVEKRHSRSESQSVTEAYSYSYDALGRETKVTHSINSGAARTISQSEYNSLRQLSKRTSGSLQVSYGYSFSGALKSISSEPFTQQIGRETPACASGLVTSVTQKFGSGPSTTTYYEYDSMGRLVQAKEGGTARSSFAYNLNGCPTAISRFGVADREGGEAVYGDIDRAAFAYDGNQLVSSTDAAVYLSYAGANDLPNGESEYAYDANGNMALDTGRGIDEVKYNRLNLPTRIACADGSVVAFEYDELGAKLAETDSIPVSFIIRPLGGFEPLPGTLKPLCNVTRTEYCGSCVYVGGKLKRLLFPGGYATPKAMGGGYDYHYYVTDYLGSVRAVVAEDGAVEETNSYYPYGMQMPDETGSIKQVQPYKYGGKERLTAAGVNLYDFGPRALYSPAAQFTSLDPKCEDYPHLSPYLYCAANPINLVDPTGMNWVGSDGDGFITWVWTDNISSEEEAKAAGYSAFRRNGSVVDNTRIGDGEYGGVYLGFSPNDVYYTTPNSTVTPWEVGTEWLTGKGPRHREFKDGDVFAKKLKTHSHYDQALKKAKDQFIKEGKNSGDDDYSLQGWGGVLKYIQDYSTLLTWGSTGNLAATYLGSYHLHWEAEMDGNTIIFHIQITNSSTMQSASRPPVIGYKSWWKNTIGKRINDSFSTGPGSETTQTFYLTERIILD